MGIHVILELETGERLKELLDPKSLTNVILALAARDTICLDAIDEYGLTVFNQLQIPRLIQELERARGLITEKSIEELYAADIARAKAVNSSPAIITTLEQYRRIRTYKKVLEHLEATLKIAKEALDRPHHYLRFDGD